MKYVRNAFRDDDFIRIRDFLQTSRTYSQQNWLIERWNFCRYFAQVFLDSQQRWADNLCLWTDEHNEIIAVVNGEGSGAGEAYFQLGNIEFCPELIADMLDFAEEKLSVVKENQRKVSLRANRDWQLHAILERKGYVQQKGIEVSTFMDLDADLPVKIPPGFQIVNAHQFTAEQQGQAHGRAFRHTDDEDFADLPQRIRGYQSMRTAPDYRPEMDFAVLSPTGEIAAFATVWHDALNHIAIFEPVGTIPKYRRKGLGKALLYAAMNQVRSLGTNRMYVGSDQRFYLDIGFQVDTTFDEVWHKVW
ncbi:GNAT family N-acetyltransferase [Vibrio quintilis]|nr:GNAT family N-acetyltransferase [Vibrio quintilis]